MAQLGHGLSDPVVGGREEAWSILVGFGGRCGRNLLLYSC